MTAGATFQRITSVGAATVRSWPRARAATTAMGHRQKVNSRPPPAIRASRKRTFIETGQQFNGKLLSRVVGAEEQWGSVDTRERPGGA